MRTLARPRLLGFLCFALIAVIFVVDALTPQLLVVAILFNAAIALSANALRRSLTIWLIVLSEIANVVAAYVNGVHDGYSWSPVALIDRALLAASFLLVGFMTLRSQELSALAAIGGEREQRSERERRLREAIQRVRESLSPELVRRAVLREAVGLIPARLGLMANLRTPEHAWQLTSGSDEIAEVPWPLPLSPAAVDSRQLQRESRASKLDKADPIDGLLLERMNAAGGAYAHLSDPGGDAVLVLATDGEISDDDVRALGAFVDASALALEQARLVERLDERTAAVAAQKDQLAQSNEVIRDIVYALAHDLRTPVRAASVTLQQALDGAYGPLPETYKEIARATLASNDDAARLIDTLLLVARYESGDFSTVREPLDLRDVVTRSTAEVAPLAEVRGVKLNVVQQESAYVEGDAMELRRALTNLLANAVAATPAGREVEVRLSSSGGRAQVVVDDEGYGIPPARRAHLFERFSGDGRAPGSGTGLGLYIVRRIVEHHGGEVRYAPRDTGSTFTIDLPLRTGAAA